MFSISFKVLFPMLASLLEIPSDSDPLGVEETRMRAATLLCKVILYCIIHSTIFDIKSVKIRDKKCC